MELTIRAMNAHDLYGVVSVHRSSFKGFFLDRMGPAFLRGYYTAVLEFPGALAYVAVDKKGGVRGFAVGFMDPQAFYRHFRECRWRLVPAILKALIREPLILVEVLRGGERVSRIAATTSTLGTVELASIATDLPRAGIGSLLLRRFVSEARAQGGRLVTLTTDMDGNDAVRAFYRRHGFVESTLESRGERRLVVYRLDLRGFRATYFNFPTSYHD